MEPGNNEFEQTQVMQENFGNNLSLANLTTHGDLSGYRQMSLHQSHPGNMTGFLPQMEISCGEDLQIIQNNWQSNPQIHQNWDGYWRNYWQLYFQRQEANYPTQRREPEPESFDREPRQRQRQQRPSRQERAPEQERAPQRPERTPQSPERTSPENTTPENNRSGLHNIVDAARQSVGQQLFKFIAGTPGRLGCAASVSAALNKAGITYARHAGVGGLMQQLLKNGWTKHDGLQGARPGDVVIVARTAGWQNGGGGSHVGIVGENGKVYHNSSGRQQWIEDSLQRVFGGGMQRFILKIPA